MGEGKLPGAERSGGMDETLRGNDSLVSNEEKEWWQLKANAKWMVGGLILGFGLGSAGWGWIERRSSERDLEAARIVWTDSVREHEAEAVLMRRKQAMSEIYLSLGRIAIEADQQDYGSASVHATEVFDGLARIASRQDLARPDRATVEHLLAARDEVIAGLATARPATAQKLGRLFLDAFEMTHSGAGSIAGAGS